MFTYILKLLISELGDLNAATGDCEGVASVVAYLPLPRSSPTGNIHRLSNMWQLAGPS